MARGKGFQGIVGAKKATTWNTPVAVGAGDGFEVIDLPWQAQVGLIEDQQIGGKSTQREGDAGNRIFSGSIRSALRFEDNLQVLLALAMGTAGAPATVDTSAKQHTLKMNDSLDGLFATLAFEILKDTKVYEFKSIKITGFTIRAQQGQRLEVEIRWVASDFDEASATNTTTTIDTVTVTSNREFALFAQMVVRANAQGGGALGAGDVLYVSGFEINVDRTMKVDQVTTELGNRISEPVQDGFSKVSGSFTFANLEDGTGGNAALLADELTKGRRKADVVITGATLIGAATQKTQVKLFLPNIQFGDGNPAIGGAGVLGWTLPFMAYRVTVAPTGFTAGYTDPLIAEIFNLRATDLLA